MPPYPNFISVPRKLPTNFDLSSSGIGRNIDVEFLISGRNVSRQNSFISTGSLDIKQKQIKNNVED